MSDLKFIVGNRKDLPNQYLEPMLKLIQAYDSERLPFKTPGIDYYRKYWNAPSSPDRKTLQMFVFKDNKLIGFGYSGWNIKYDHFDNGFLQVYVTPTERRKGYGKEILLRALKEIPTKIQTLRISVKEDSIGELVLKKYKLKKGFEETIRGVKLSEFSLQELQMKIKQETARINQLGYSFIELEAFDYKEKFNETDYVKMVEQIWNDMPREELNLGEDVITIERYNAMIQSTIDKGNRTFGVAIALKETNQPVGHSRVLHNKFDPDLIEQDDTGVIHEHRGNGFGYVLKLKLLERILTETEATLWITGNADSNVHMIRINDLLKHKILGKIVTYELNRKDWELS